MIRRFLARLFRPAPAPAPVIPALYASWYMKLSLEATDVKLGDTIRLKRPARFEGAK